MPKVSVLMTNYNGSKYIREAIESILWQNYRDFEFIIVDDWSTDKSWSIIQEYQKKDTRIQCYRNKQNNGIAFTRNRLIDISQGDFVAWLDSDDIARDDRLTLQLDFLEKNHQYGIIGSWVMIINGAGEEKWVKQLPISDKEIRKQWYFRNSLNHPTLMMRRSCLKKTGYYDTKLEIADDYDYWVRAWRHCLLANIPDTLIKYRIHTDNISIKKHKKTIQETILIRKKMENLGYKMSWLARIAFIITWFVQFIPPKLSVFLFYSFIKVFSQKKTEVK